MFVLLSEANSVDSFHRCNCRFSDNVHVKPPNGWMRFYCGTPLLASNGHHLGTLCILDSIPREMDASQCALINNFGELVSRHIEQRQLAHMDEKRAMVGG